VGWTQKEKKATGRKNKSLHGGGWGLGGLVLGVKKKEENRYQIKKNGCKRETTNKQSIEKRGGKKG